MKLISKIRNKGISIINSLVKFRECPLCGWTGFRFLPYGNAEKNRRDAQCPSCGSLERHRAVYILLREQLGELQQILHIAPEPPIEKWLRQISDDYLSIDLFKTAMRTMDLTELDLPDQSKSLVFCSHVLEHIPEDIKAMSEMYRVLKTNGIAIIQVPIWKEVTYEDFSITTKEGRLRAFMQEDHVRLYGLDIVNRIESVGFKVVVKYVDELPDSDIHRYSLKFKSTNQVFVCQKV